MPYLLEKLYADLCGLFMFRYQLNEGRIRNLNRLHREMKIYFSEYKDAFGKIEGQFSLQVLRIAPFPEDLITLGSDRIRQVWRDANPRGRGYSRAGEILKYVRKASELKMEFTLIVIACKILRVIYTILTKRIKCDPKKLLADIKRPAQQAVQVA